VADILIGVVFMNLPKVHELFDLSHTIAKELFDGVEVISEGEKDFARLWHFVKI
jgi:hypothetical protein